MIYILMFTSASTGTLLNRLFGTTFDVMDESQRRQTTKGTPQRHSLQQTPLTCIYRHLDVQRKKHERFGYGC